MSDPVPFRIPHPAQRLQRAREGARAVELSRGSDIGVQHDTSLALHGHPERLLLFDSPSKQRPTLASASSFLLSGALKPVLVPAHHCTHKKASPLPHNDMQCISRSDLAH